MPEEIERILVSHLNVSDAVVTGVADDLYGQRVVAHFLTTECCEEINDESLIADLRQHCVQLIPLARAPREYHRWHEFPRQANGKPDRAKIAERGQTIG